ncbi:MAG: hypothetical protein ACXWMB_02235 [Candidatus Limnocylindria bacterium]
MDERDLEQRLQARLHARFDGAQAPDRLHQAIDAALRTSPHRSWWQRHLSAGWPLRLVTVGAAVVAVVVVVIGFTALPGLLAGPVGSSSPSPASPSSGVPTSGPSAQPTGAALPLDWTGLSVSALQTPRPGEGTIVPWAGGYVAIAPETTDGPPRVWSSGDGRSWIERPASTFGFDDPTGNTLFNSATGCGDSVLIETVDGSGAVSLWSSSDASTWTQSAFHNDSRGDLVAIGGTAVANVDTGGGAANGMALDVTTDCATWRRVTLPGPAVGQITGLAANGSGFVAVGYSGVQDSGGSQPLAWWSSDGQHWAAASVPTRRGDGFDQVWAGSGGFVALTTQPGRTPGLQALWTSADGHAWAPFAKDPLGTVQQGEGVGSPAGSVIGDGVRLLIYGRPNVSAADDSAGTAQYWISTDAIRWTRLAIAGPEGPAMLADQYPVPALLRDGVLFAGASTTWFGAP